MLIVHNAVEANDFACHLKACDLVSAIFGGQASFEKAGANGVKRRELFAVAKQGGAFFNFAAGGDQVV